MIQLIKYERNRLSLFLMLLVVGAGLTSCVTAVGYAPEETLSVTLNFATTSDHFGLKVEGVDVIESSVDAPAFAQPQWINTTGSPTTVEGAQGVPYASQRKTMAFVWNLTLKKRDGVEVISLPYWKGHIGTNTLVITYTDVNGKVATQRFSAPEGPAAAVSTWRVELKPFKN